MASIRKLQQPKASSAEPIDEAADSTRDAFGIPETEEEKKKREEEERKSKKSGIWDQLNPFAPSEMEKGIDRASKKKSDK
jgi:hypothetical protein